VLLTTYALIRMYGSLSFFDNTNLNFHPMTNLQDRGVTYFFFFERT